MKFEVLLRVREMTNEELVLVALKMAEKHPGTFEKIVLGKEGKLSYTVPGTNEPVMFTPAEVREFEGYVASCDKVKCIKRVREIAKIGLKDAKELVEANWFKNVRMYG